MSRSWNEKELQIASRWMKEHGFLSYEEFCEALEATESERKEEGESSTAETKES